MKFLIIVSMILSSLVASANDRDVKCYERSNGDMDLSYIIKKWDADPTLNAKYKLLDCRDDQQEDKNCDFRGILKVVERQDENCLVLKGRHGESATGDSWELCLEQQETLEGRLVPVTVTDDRQESRVFCERSIRHIL